MYVINAFLIAVSMYSKIPVPQPEWKEENMKYIFCFFPWRMDWRLYISVELFVRLFPDWHILQSDNFCSYTAVSYRRDSC